MPNYDKEYQQAKNTLSGEINNFNSPEAIQKRYEEWKSIHDTALENTHQYMYNRDLAMARSRRDAQSQEEIDARKSKLIFDDDGTLKNDSDITKALKSAWNNTVGKLGEPLKFDIIDNGKRVDSGNKAYDFFGNSFSKMSDKEFLDYYKNAPDDPDAQSVLYSYRKYDGKDDNGNDKYIYKVGQTKASAWDRVKGNFAKQGIELLSEKRFGGVDEYEREFQKRFIKNRVVDKGNNYKSGFNFNDGYTEFYDKDILGVDNGQTTRETRQNMLESQAKGKEYYKKHAGSNNWYMGDKHSYRRDLAAGSINLAGGLVDLMSTGLGYALEKAGIENDLENNIGDYMQENADKWSGRDTQQSKEAMRESIAAFRRGDYFDAVFNDLGAKSGVLVESLPEMGLMFASGPAGWTTATKKVANAAKILSKAREELAWIKSAKGVSNTLEGAKKAQKLESQIASATRIIEKAGHSVDDIEKLVDPSIFAKLGSKLSKDAGFNAIWAKNTNEIIEQRKQEKGVEDVSIGEVLGIAASQYLLTGLDKWTFSDIAKSPAILNSLKSAYKTAKDTGMGSAVVSALAKSITEVGTSAGEEGFQEAVQTAGEILGTKLDVNGQNIYDVLGDEKNQNEIIGASMMGAGAGGHMSLASQGVRGVFGTAKKGIDTFKDYRDSKKANNFDENGKLYVSPNVLKKKIINTLNDPVKTLEERVSLGHEAINDLLSYDNVKPDENGMKDLFVAGVDGVFSSTLPKEHKEEMFNKLMSSDKLSDPDKKYLADNVILLAMEALDDEIQTASFGSKTIDINEDSIFGEEKTSFTDNSPKVNPVKGKLDHIIESLSSTKKALLAQGLDTKKIDTALKVIDSYNNADTFEKAIGDVSAEIETIGFISNDGKTIKPSLSAYEAGLERNILTGSGGFAGLSNFSNFVKSRLDKSIDYNMKGQQNFVAQTNSENKRMLDLVTHILSSNSERLDPETKDELANIQSNLTNKIVETNNKSLKAFNRSKELIGKFTPEEEAMLASEAMQIKTVGDAVSLASKINKELTDPETSTTILRAIADVTAGKDNPFLNKQATKSDKTVDKLLIDAEKGTLDPADVTAIENKKDINEDIKAYIKSSFINKSKPILNNVDQELDLISKANNLDDAKKIIQATLQNNRVTYDQYNNMIKQAYKINQVTKAKENLLNAKTRLDAVKIWKDNSNIANELEQDKEFMSKFKRHVTAIEKNRIDGQKKASKDKFKESATQSTSKYKTSNNDRSKDVKEEYDVKTAEQEIKEFEWLQSELDKLDKDNRDLSPEHKKVFENARKQLQKEIDITKIRLGKASRIKDNKMRNSAIKHVVKIFKKSIDKLNKIIKNIAKKIKILNKYTDLIDNYIGTGSVNDLRTKPTAKKAIQEAIKSKKKEIKAIKDKAKKEPEEKIKEKLKEDVDKSKIKDTSSLRSSIKTKLEALAYQSAKRLNSIDMRIDKLTNDIVNISKTIDYLTDYKTKMLEKYNNTILSHARLISKESELKNKVNKQLNLVKTTQEKLDLLAIKLKNKKISKEKFNKEVNKYENWINNYKENINRYKANIDSIRKNIKKIEEKMNSIEKNIDDKNIEKKIKELNKLIEIRNKINNTLNKLKENARKEQYDKLASIGRDISNIESSKSIELETDITIKKDPEKILKTVNSVGSKIIENSSSSIKPYLKERKTPLSEYAEMFSDPDKKTVNAIVEKYNLKNDTFEAIEFMSKYIKKLDDINIKETDQLKYDENGNIDTISGKEYINALQSIGLDNKDIQEVIKFGIASMAMSFNTVKYNILQKDDKDLASDLGVDPAEIEMYKDLIYAGYIPRVLLINEISGLVLNRLGISFTKDTPIRTKELIEKSVLSAVDAGFKAQFANNGFNEQRKQFNGKDMLFYVFDGVKEENYQKYFSRISYMNPSGSRQKVKNKPYKVSTKDTVINSFVNLSEKQVENINKMNNIEYRFHTENIEHFIKKYKNNKYKALEAFGYVKLNNNMMIQDMMLQKAHNEKIEREAEIMLDYYEEFKNNGFYIPHGITKSNRYNMRSDLNIQESKIHRAFVYSKDYEATIDARLKRDILDIPYDNINETEMFEAALHQSFDMDTDKKSHYAVFKEIRDRIDIYDKNGVKIKYKKNEDSWKALDTFINASSFDFEALSTIFHSFGGMHAVQASMELRRLNRTSNKGNFKTTLFIEADAITSGTMLLFMKKPNAFALKMLEKGGVYTKESKAKWEKYVKEILSKKYSIDKKHFILSAGSLIEAGQYHLQEGFNKQIDGKIVEPFIDIYTTVGELSLKEFKRFKEEKDAEGKTEYDKLTPENKKLFDMAFGENPTLKDLRKLSKDPTMVFNYGALLNSIKRSLTRNTYVKNIYSLIEKEKSLTRLTKVIKEIEYTKLYNKEAKYADDESKINKKELAKKATQKAKEYISDLKNYKVFDSELNTFREPTIEEYNKMINDKLLYKHIVINNTLENDIHMHYSVNNIGKFYEKSFDKIFGDISSMRVAGKVVDMFISKMFNIKLKTELNNLKQKGKPITQENFIESIKRLQELGFGHTMDIGDNIQPLYKKDRLPDTDNTRGFVTLIGKNGKQYQASLGLESIEFIDNSGAAVTIPIHAADGRMMIEALKNNDFTNIYDAILAGVNQTKILEATANYNAAFIKESFKSQDFKSYFEKMNKMFDSLTDEEFNQLSKELSPLQKDTSVQYNDKAIYIPTDYVVVKKASFKLKSGKSVYTNDTVYRQNKNQKIRMIYKISKDSKNIIAEYIDDGHLARKAEVFIDGSTANINFQTFVWNGKGVSTGSKANIQVSSSINTKINIDPARDFTPEYINEIINNAIKSNIDDIKNIALETGENKSIGIVPTYPEKKNNKDKFKTVNPKFISPKSKIKSNIDIIGQDKSGFKLSRNIVLKLTGLGTGNLTEVLKKEVSNMNNSIDWFNNNENELYSNQMFVNGVKLTKVELNSNNKPKKVNEYISDKLKQFEEKIHNDAITYIRSSLNDVESSRFLSTLEFNGNRFKMTESSFIVNEAIANILESDFGIKTIEPATGIKENDTIQTIESLSNKANKLLNDYIENKNKGC